MDTIADFLTAIRNGYLAKRETITVNVSKTRLEIVKILKEAGFVSDFTVIEEKPVSKLTVTLRYFEKDLPAIAGIKRVSKPSVRIHKAYNEIPLTLLLFPELVLPSFPLLKALWPVSKPRRTTSEEKLFVKFGKHHYLKKLYEPHRTQTPSPARLGKIREG